MVGRASTSLHPVIDVKVGSYIFNTIPEHIQEFTETNRVGLSQATFKLIDPTYVELERAIIEENKGSGIVQYRWGFPELDKYTEWKRFTPTNILPDISPSSYSLTVEGYAIVSREITKIRPRTYKGKISDVVTQIVRDINRRAQEQGDEPSIKVAFIEETDDENNIDKPWSTGNLSTLDFLVQKLRPLAVSKTYKKEGYLFACSNSGVFRFHTKEFKGGSVIGTSGTTSGTKGQEFRKFICLFGVPSGVVSFQPNYSSPAIVADARGWVISTVDPLRKQYQERAVNRKTVPTEDFNARTTAPPPDPTNPEDTSVAGLYAHGPSSVGDLTNAPGSSVPPQQTLDRLTNQFKLLNNRVQGGTLELVGLPEFLDFSPSEFHCDISCILPDRTTEQRGGGSTITGRKRQYTGQRLHWTSGRYFILQVVHSITGQYTITAQLSTATGLDGPADSKTVVAPL